jgi:hypothetical protein
MPVKKIFSYYVTVFVVLDLIDVSIGFFSFTFFVFLFRIFYVYALAE